MSRHGPAPWRGAPFGQRQPSLSPVARREHPPKRARPAPRWIWRSRQPGSGNDGKEAWDRWKLPNRNCYRVEKKGEHWSNALDPGRSLKTALAAIGCFLSFTNSCKGSAIAARAVRGGPQGRPARSRYADRRLGLRCATPFARGRRPLMDHKDVRPARSVSAANSRGGRKFGAKYDPQRTHSRSRRPQSRRARGRGGGPSLTHDITPPRPPGSTPEPWGPRARRSRSP